MFIYLVFTNRTGKRYKGEKYPMVFKDESPSVSDDEIQKRLDALYGRGKHKVVSVQAWLYDGLSTIRSQS